MTLYVIDKYGEDITKTNQYLTIQEAIDVANEGDTIHIGVGTYNEKLVINKKGVTLIGDSKGRKSH